MTDKMVVDIKEFETFEADAKELLKALTTLIPLMRTIYDSDELSDARKEIDMGKLVDQYLPA